MTAPKSVFYSPENTVIGQTNIILKIRMCFNIWETCMTWVTSSLEMLCQACATVQLYSVPLVCAFSFVPSNWKAALLAWDQVTDLGTEDHSQYAVMLLSVCSVKHCLISVRQHLSREYGFVHFRIHGSTYDSSYIINKHYGPCSTGRLTGHNITSHHVGQRSAVLWYSRLLLSSSYVSHHSGTS